jgi:hypothetical protein
MGIIDSAKDFILRRPTPQEQQVNTGGVMEPFAPLTSQVPQMPVETQTPAPSPEPNIAAMPTNIGEPAPVPDTTPSSDQQATPIPPSGSTSEQQAA